MSSQSTFLTLPLEIRLHIYTSLLNLPPLPIYIDDLPSSRPVIHPAILLVCRQTHHEATPSLYRDNTFTLSEHPTRPAPYSSRKDVPRRSLFLMRLRRHLKPTPWDVAAKHGARRFVVQWRKRDVKETRVVDDNTALRMRDLLSGAERVRLQLLVAGYLEGLEGGRMEFLEGVRGVGRVELLGATRGTEGYLGWLRGVMMSNVGKEMGKSMLEIG